MNWLVNLRQSGGRPDQSRGLCLSGRILTVSGSCAEVLGVLDMLD